MPLVLRLAKLSRRLATIRTLTASAILVVACSESSTGPSSAPAELPFEEGMTPSFLPANTGPGDRVEVMSTAYIRSAASVKAALAGTQPVGARGTVIGTGVVDADGDGLTRYPVNFDRGVDGWAAAPYLHRFAAAPAVTQVVMTPKSATVAAGATATLSATARTATGTIVQGATITWRSRDTTKVRVSSAGLVTAIAAGTAWVLASSGSPADSAVITVAGASAPTVRVGRYVAPDGASSNDGTYARPWPLATALSGGGGRVAAGDTIWVRGGTYRGTFVSTLTGTSSRSIVVRAYPGERAILAHEGSITTSTLHVKGAWSVFWGLEVMDPSTSRYTTVLGNSQRPHGVVNNAPNTKYINLVVHDVGVAFYNYPEMANVEVTGNIVYNNGWQAPDRGHGHALYVKSDVGPVLVRDNILFNQYGYGVHIYSNAGSGDLRNIRVEGNTAFNNGVLSNNSDSDNILVGGDAVATGNTVTGNIAYFSPGAGGRNVRIGFGATANGSVTVADNQFVGGSPVLELGRWSSATVRNNTFIGAAQMIRANYTLAGSWSGNTHRRSATATAWLSGGTWRTFSAWRSATGMGSTDVATSTAATGRQVLVRPSPYEAGRATITVIDHGATGSATVALSGVLAVGERYEVRSVQSLYGAPLVSGTFTGSLVLPMGQVTAPRAIGGSTTAPRTGAAFDVFLVTRVP